MKKTVNYNVLHPSVKFFSPAKIFLTNLRSFRRVSDNTPTQTKDKSIVLCILISRLLSRGLEDKRPGKEW